MNVAPPQPGARAELSVQELSARSGIPLRTVQRYVAHWEATGIVRVVRRKAPGAARKWGHWIDCADAERQLGVRLDCAA